MNVFAKRGCLVVLAFVLAGCAHHLSPRAECGNTISVPREVLEARVLLLGEVHGTVEAPRFTGDLVCQLASAGKTVVLGIEHESDLQPVYDRVIAGDADAVAQISKQTLWSGKFTDGRFTRAIYELILRARDMRAAGLAVQLRAIDASSREMEVAHREGRLMYARDERMAANASTIVRALPKDGVLVIMAGNIHTSRVMEPLGPGVRVAPPMGYLLDSQGVISLEFGHLGGTASVYGAPASGRAFGTSSVAGTVWSIELFGRPNDRGLNGKYLVGPITASPHFQIERPPLRGFNGVVCDVSGKPPATIEWE